ncbi:MAG TPA: dihydrolipoamide acetyltransferase family protein [Chitinophagales bacterium]|nr:dihydrolipoamide acetyltransferase family protein [Chitinophagales bacterium]
MSEFQLTMPKMGESVIEATILTWNKKVGETIHENEILLEVATDKVDSEVPSPVTGVLKEILFNENDVVAVDQVIAIIETDGDVSVKNIPQESATIQKETKPEEEEEEEEEEKPIQEIEEREEIEEIPTATESVPFVPVVENKKEPIQEPITTTSSNRFYSPLVLNIAKVEGISSNELDNIQGSGQEGRVTKEDILKYLEDRKSPKSSSSPQQETASTTNLPTKAATSSSKNQDEIIEMDRMRKLISKNMMHSLQTSAHVSSFIEVDMTPIVQWREKHKIAFKKREGYSLSYMPIFTEAIAKAIRDFPMINISVDGDKIIKKKNINIGIAAALPTGNLIVPVIKNADQMNLSGLASTIQELATKARANKLTATEIEGGTYTISNIGTFGNILGTPIIPQPQVAIMAVGAITKKPVVLETKEGDVIAIRHMMYLSHTYDHRVVDGALGGMFVKKVADYLENFDIHQEI